MKRLDEKRADVIKGEGGGEKGSCCNLLQGFEGSKDPRNAHHFIHVSFEERKVYSIQQNLCNLTRNDGKTPAIL